ncbi:MAG: hypothetical protein WC699_17160 [Bacteroidales bacterium]|jgi:hypothetical protein
MKVTSKTLGPIVLLLVAIVLIVIQLLSTGVSGETDSIFHYQIARYAFKYPEFLLNHWGKPLYTILSAPFAQFGFTGTIVFNLTCGLLSAWFAYLIARRLEYRHAWVAIVFTIFTPVYLFIMYSGLTEIIFSLVLIAGIYLFISKRFIWSAVVISLIPFARTEGVMYIILMIPALLWMRQYKALPFLLTGFVVFGLAGLPQYHDPFWFFTKMPYNTSSADLYGSGSFWTYFKDMGYILNYPLIIMVIAGLAFLLLDLRKVGRDLRNIKYVTLYLLIIPSIFGFILAQSFLWWKGLGILVSIRFMACVLPLVAILAITGFERLMLKARFSNILTFVFGTYVIFLVVYKPFTYHVVPSKTAINFAVMEKLTTWLKSSPYNDRRVLYTDPMYPFYRGTDPFDSQINYKVYSYENKKPVNLLNQGELLLWDPQFAGFEGHLPLDSLMNNPNFRLINIFTPVESFTVIGGEEYKLALFMKAPRDTNGLVYQPFYLNDFESGLSAEEMTKVTQEHCISGKQSMSLSPSNVYSASAQGKLKFLPDSGFVSIRSSVRILNPDPTEKGKILLVVSIEDADRKIYRYMAVKDSETDYKPGEWFDLSRTDLIDANTPAGGSYKVYVWYTGKNKIYVDDLKLEYLPAGK